MTKTIETQTDKYFDEYTRNVRTALAWVYPTEFRAILEKAVDLQVEAGKFMAKTATDAVSKLAPAAK
jgi:predicted metal-dependent HD superfamily phosphohydrolase